MYEAIEQAAESVGAKAIHVRPSMSGFTYYSDVVRGEQVCRMFLPIGEPAEYLAQRIENGLQIGGVVYTEAWTRPDGTKWAPTLE